LKSHILFFALLLMLAIGFCAPLLAQADITIGYEPSFNSRSQGPTPYSTYHYSFRQQYLLLASEIEDAGGAAGLINSVAFNVRAVNNCYPMMNYTIRLKHTEQTSLTNAFEEGSYHTALQQDYYQPVTGWNVHNFSNPFIWDGTSNLLVEVVTFLNQSNWSFHASAFLSYTGFNSSLRFESYNSEAIEATTGTTALTRTNMRFNMQPVEASTPPNPANAYAPQQGQTGVSLSQKLHWGGTGGAPLTYKVHFGTTNPPPYVLDTSDNMHDPVLDVNTTYYWQIKPSNNAGNAENCPVWNFNTGGHVANMNNGSLLLTEGVTYSFYDSGGPLGQYETHEDYVYTFTAAPGSMIHVEFSDFDLQYNDAFLKIFDGPDASAPQVGPVKGYSGDIAPAQLFGSDAVTFAFTSGSNYRRDGWIAQVTAYSPEHDLGALSIQGSQTPTAGELNSYIVKIKNNGSHTETGYRVKLMDSEGTELAYSVGTAIAPGQSLDVNVDWSPELEGPFTIYGEVELTGDELSINNETDRFELMIQPEGTITTTIGSGNELCRVPMDFYMNGSRYLGLYYPEELGFVEGTISSISFYNSFENNLLEKPTKIWMYSTDLQDLTSDNLPIEQMTPVFDGVVDYPAGENTIRIPLQTQFEHNHGNLLVMVERPWGDLSQGLNNMFWGQTGNKFRALHLLASYESAWYGWDPKKQFPKTTFHYVGQRLMDDLSVLSITGSINPAIGIQNEYVVNIRNNGLNAQNDWEVKLFTDGGQEVAFAAGTSLDPKQSIEVTLSWNPQISGHTFVYAMVQMQGDQIAANNRSADLKVYVIPEGTFAATVGQGGANARMPMDFYWKHSLFETIYHGSEIGTPGLLTSIQFYNNFYSNLLNKPTQIWIGETSKSNLQEGWIPSDELVPVFSGLIDYPRGENIIHIPLQTPYAYNGGNLVMMFNRPFEHDWFSDNDNFVSQTGNISNRTLIFRSDDMQSDTENPQPGELMSMFPKATFVFITDGLGAISGVVSAEGMPLEGATVFVEGTYLTYTTGNNGVFSFPYIEPGNYVVTASKHGYYSVSHGVNIEADETSQQNFELVQMPRVNLSGRLVGSDTPTFGLSNASIVLDGFNHYEANTNTQGEFFISDVYANQIYSYKASAEGYQKTLGEVSVEESDIQMGDIVLLETANPPLQVTAVESFDNMRVDLNWLSPGEGTGGDWLHYDNGENYTSIGTDSALELDVAIRFPASALLPYTGMSLQAVKAWPSHYGTYSIRVWTGTSPEAPDQTVLNQPFSPEIDAYNTIILNNPVPITGEEELWVGYNFNVQNGFPAGCDAGPAVDGLGNMLNWFGTWIPLTALDPSLNFNWNIQAYAGYNAPERAPEINLLALDAKGASRAMTGFQVYRLLASNTGNPSLWELLTSEPIEETQYSDNSWNQLSPNVYRYAVRTAYTNGVFSVPAFSNIVEKDMMGVLTGTVTDYGTGLPVSGAVIKAGEYVTATNDLGQYSMAVYQGSYTVTCSKEGFQTAIQTNVNILGLQTSTLDFVLNEVTLSPQAVTATEATDHSHVQVSWIAPNHDNMGQWLHYDSGENYDSIGTGGSDDLSVAIRFPAGTLTDFAGMKLHAMKVWPAAHGDYSIRVWMGENEENLSLVVDQPFIPVLDEYNTVMLDNPPTITGNEELYIGYNFNVLGGFPAGCDQGPAIDGLGNLLNYMGMWLPLTVLNSQLDFNWNIQGFVGHVPPSKFTDLKPLVLKRADKPNDRAMTGFHVYRFLREDIDNENLWDRITDTQTDQTDYIDSDWQNLPSGAYQYAVKTVYTNDLLSAPAFSNIIDKDMMGLLEGTVTDFVSGLPIEGATVTAGAYHGQTNEQGYYSFNVYQGNYNVTCAQAGYQTILQTDVNVAGLQTTTLDFSLVEMTLPPIQVQAVESNPNLVDLEWLLPGSGDYITEGFEGETFPPSGWSQIITDNSEPASNGILPTWCSFGVIDIYPDPPIYPHSGENQAAIWWSNNHQDEWLITPQFLCPPDAALSFWNCVFMGSPYGDHYWVKLSQDGGNNWTPLWDASALSGGWSLYEYPIQIDLKDYSGQLINLAWHAEDSAANNGLWFAWSLDDISVSNSKSILKFPARDLVRSSSNPKTKAAVSTNKASQDIRLSKGLAAKFQTASTAAKVTQNKNSRGLSGFKVWRLPAGQEENESAWIQILPGSIEGVTCQDTGWGNVPEGEYRWAVKAVYSEVLESAPAFSNILFKEQQQVTPVELSSFTATLSGDMFVNIAWTSQTEQQMMGYRIYRNTSDDQSGAIQIVHTMVPATNTSESHTYSLVDTSVMIDQTYHYWLEAVGFNSSNFHGPVSVTVHGNVPPVLPEITSMKNAYPNPFKAGNSTNIEIAVKAGETGTLTIYNVAGQVVKSVSLTEGNHIINWNGRDNKGAAVGSGIYFYKLSTPSLNQTRKMILMK